MSGQKRKQFSIDEKVSIINRIENGEKQADLCKQLNIPSSTLSTIIKSKDKIRAAYSTNISSKRKKLRVSSKRDLDMALLNWYQQQIQQNNQIQITGPILLEKASQFGVSLGYGENFRCSNGFLNRWKIRNNIYFNRTHNGNRNKQEQQTTNNNNNNNNINTKQIKIENNNINDIDDGDDDDEDEDEDDDDIDDIIDDSFKIENPTLIAATHYSDSEFSGAFNHGNCGSNGGADNNNNNNHNDDDDDDDYDDEEELINKKRTTCTLIEAKCYLEKLKIFFNNLENVEILTKQSLQHLQNFLETLDGKPIIRQRRITDYFIKKL